VCALGFYEGRPAYRQAGTQVCPYNEYDFMGMIWLAGG